MSCGLSVGDRVSEVDQLRVGITPLANSHAVEPPEQVGLAIMQRTQQDSEQRHGLAHLKQTFHLQNGCTS